MAQVNFVFCLHNHQPVDNFDHVLAKATDDSYLPFLELMERHPGVAFVAHYSGPLLEWFQANRLEVMIKLRAMADAGRLELLGGGMYEPIFSMLTEEDAVGQLNRMSEYLRKHLAAEPQGLWLPERVWEPGLVSTLAKAGLRYTVVDDFHFRAAGVRDEELTGHFLTEDRGSLFSVFPLKEDLRYSIPYKDPQWTVDYLLRYADETGSKTIVYADDGEKFGVWPRTKEHVFGSGWLERFLDALERNADRIRTVTFREALKKPPAGRVYLPSCSYREMGEWSMMGGSQGDFEGLVEELRRQGRFEAVKHFLPGGTWRNFRAKYPEANLMYGRMLAVSRRVAELPATSGARRRAEDELYRGQCNCGYWHGVFGGLYLPHLRNSVYRHLILAENEIDASKTRAGTPHGYKTLDLDLDGREDVRLYNDKLNVFVSPARGGAIMELDYRPEAVNFGATLARHREHYHAKVRQAVVAPPDQAKSIHDLVLAKQADLDRHLVYDARPRASLLDRFFAPDAGLEDAIRNAREIADFPDGPYAFAVGRRDPHVTLDLRRERAVRPPGEAPAAVAVEKQIALGRESEFQVHYTLRNASERALAARFAVEFNLAALSPKKAEAWIEGLDASLGEPRVFERRGEIAIRDGWRDLRLTLRTSSEAAWWLYPVHTVSMSEGGFELGYQETAILPTWLLRLEPGARWSVAVTFQVARA
jgi:alpha-amylase